MAYAITVQVVGSGVEADGVIWVQYMSLVSDPGVTGGSMPVFFHIPEGMTPGQFRSGLTEATLAAAATYFPSVTLTHSDCMVDTMQTGTA